MMRRVGWLFIVWGVVAVGWAIAQASVDALALMSGCAIVVSGVAILLTKAGMDVLAEHPDERGAPARVYDFERDG